MNPTIRTLLTSLMIAAVAPIGLAALDLEQAVFGTSTEIDFQTVKECTECGGSGAARGHAPVTCETCSGSGQVRISQGIFAVQQTCPRCKGRGSIIKDPCPKCAGHGRTRALETA